MIEFFITTLRLARSVGSAYRRGPQFRSLVFLVLATLLGGTLFTASSRVGAQWMHSTSAPPR